MGYIEGAVAGVPIQAYLSFEWGGLSIVSYHVYNKRPSRLYMLEEKEVIWVGRRGAKYGPRSYWGHKMKLFVELFERGQLMDVIVCDIEEDMHVTINTVGAFGIDVVELFCKTDAKFLSAPGRKGVDKIYFPLCV